MEIVAVSQLVFSTGCTGGHRTNETNTWWAGLLLLSLAARFDALMPGTYTFQPRFCLGALRTKTRFPFVCDRLFHQSASWTTPDCVCQLP